MRQDQDLRHLAKLYDRGDQLLHALHLHPTLGGLRLPTLPPFGISLGSQLTDDTLANVLAYHPAFHSTAPRVVAVAALSSLPSHGGYDVGDLWKA
jgi:hypothetical protein